MVTARTRIDASHRIEGTLEAGEPVSFGGHLVGEVISDAPFVVEVDAIVEGEIHATEVVILGTVVGTVEGIESVTVGATGQVAGDIKTRALHLHAGGRVQGQVESAVSVARRQANRGRGASRSSSAARGATAHRGRPVTAPKAATKAQDSPPISKPKRSSKSKGKAKSSSKRSRAAHNEEVELSPEVVELDNLNEPAKS